ncbi:MAG TPA: glycosyltransferase family A protein, partial [Gemmatimonadales bacterium]
MSHPGDRMPLVSVIIPAYMVAPYIAEAVESALRQTWSPVEVLVINDGSPDSPAMEEALRPFRDRIRYIVQENQGASVARNAGIAAAKGSLIAFLDGDDIWYPGFLASQVSFLERGGYGMVYANALLFGDHPQAGLEYMQTTPSRGPVTLRSLLELKCHPLTSGTVLHRTSLEGVGPFDPGLRRGQDFDLWLRLAHAGVRIGYQQAVLLKYRIREGSLSGNAIAQAQRELGVFERIGEKLPLDATERRIVERQIHRLRGRLEIAKGKACLTARDYAGARAHFRAAGWERGGPKLVLVRVLARVAPSLLRAMY